MSAAVRHNAYRSFTERSGSLVDETMLLSRWLIVWEVDPPASRLTTSIMASVAAHTATAAKRQLCRNSINSTAHAVAIHAPRLSETANGTVSSVAVASSSTRESPRLV